jgi:hypothetical protein
LYFTRSQNHRSNRLLKPFPAWKQIAVFPGTLIRAVSTGGQIAVFFQICRKPCTWSLFARRCREPHNRS